MMRVAAACVVAFLVVSSVIPEAEGLGRRRWRQRRAVTSYHLTGGPQQVAEQKAAIQARSNSMFHPAGGFGGGYAEGVGCAGTAQGALANCCFTGQRVVLGAAVRQGSNGLWYACKIYR